MLQDQTKKMQEKLIALRLQVEQQKKLKETTQYQSTVDKWKKLTNTDAPLKDYAKKVLADRKEALNKYGINQKKIISSKSFQPALTKIKSQKRQQEERQGTKIPKFEVAAIIQPQHSQLPEQSVFRQSSSKLTTASQIKSPNFTKAKIVTKSLIHRKTLEQFLQQNFLQMYLPILKANNINELEDLFYLNRQKMTQFDIKSGHQAKIIKRIAQQINNQDKQKNQNKSKPEQPIETGSSEKVSFGYGDGDINSYVQLNNPNSQFLANQNLQNNQENPHENEYQSEEQDNQSQNEDQVILTQPTLSQFSIQTQEQVNVVQQNYNLPTCFQCYKKFSVEGLISSDSRIFCSTGCLNKYLQFMQKKCPQCDSAFYKFDGYFSQGLWFCSIGCSPNLQQIEGMFLQWNTQNSKQRDMN